MLSQISVTNPTPTGFTVTFAGATDNVGVAGYEKSVGDVLDYEPIGLNTTFNVTGKASSTSYTVNVRSFDLAGNYSDPITTLGTTAPPVVVPTNPVPVFNGPAIGNIAAAQSIAIAPINVSTKFSDTEAITFSQSPAGMAWPTGLVISQQGVISGSVATVGFNLGLRVRATDSVGQTADSNSFNITVTEEQVNPIPTGAPAPNPAQLHVGGSRTNFSPKRPQEVEILTIDFTPNLSFGETITEATWSMSVVRGIDPNPEAMLVGSAGIANELVSHFVQGGLADVIYAPICAVKTSKGQTIVLPEPKSGLLRIAG